MISAGWEYESDFSLPKQRKINSIARPVGEAIRVELGGREVVAPFRKMAVELVRSGERMPEQWFLNALSVLIVCVTIGEEALFGPVVEKNHALLDAVGVGLDEAEAMLGWESAEMREIVRGLYDREPICRVERSKLSKRDRKTGLEIVVIYELTEDHSGFYAEFRTEDGSVVRSETIAYCEEGWEFEDFFPVKSSIIVGRRLVFRDRERKELAAIELD